MLVCKNPATTCRVGRRVRWFGIDRAQPRTTVDVARSRLQVPHEQRDRGHRPGAAGAASSRCCRRHIENGCFYERALDGHSRPSRPARSRAARTRPTGSTPCSRSGATIWRAISPTRASNARRCTGATMSIPSLPRRSAQLPGLDVLLQPDAAHTRAAGGSATKNASTSSTRSGVVGDRLAVRDSPLQAAHPARCRRGARSGAAIGADRRRRQPAGVREPAARFRRRAVCRRRRREFSRSIEMALRMAGVGPGDSVLLSPLACLATTMPLAAGRRPAGMVRHRSR